MWFALLGGLALMCITIAASAIMIRLILWEIRKTANERAAGKAAKERWYEEQERQDALQE
jgi:hypothetical protein